MSYPFMVMESHGLMAWAWSERRKLRRNNWGVIVIWSWDKEQAQGTQQWGMVSDTTWKLNFLSFCLHFTSVKHIFAGVTGRAGTVTKGDCVQNPVVWNYLAFLKTFNFFLCN